MKPQAIWTITDNNRDLKSDINVLVKKADMNAVKLIPLLKAYFETELENWKAETELEGLAMLFAAFAQSAIASMAYEDLLRLAIHCIGRYKEEHG